MARRTRKNVLVAGVLAAAAGTAGCLDEPTTDGAAQEVGPGALAAAASCPTVATDVDKSLLITEATALARFPFERVMDQILASVKHDPGQDSRSVFRAWMETFGPSPCPGAGIDPNGYGIVCPRFGEADLAGSDPFDPADDDFFHPVALVNRFDLAPQDGSHCGEYRIIFAKQSLGGADRAFLIFEAVLPNRNPEQGLAGCFPVASLWQSLSAKTPIQRANTLEKFYFDGLSGFEPVIAAGHYGLIARRGDVRLAGYGTPDRAGQVRTNTFLDGGGPLDWNLREFKLDLDCTDSPPTPDDGHAATIPSPLPDNCRFRFQHVVDAENPAEELFTQTHVNALAFEQDFVSSDVETLAASGVIDPDCGGDANAIGMNIPDDFNEFESMSSGSNATVYDNFATTSLRVAIQNQLGAIGSPLSTTHLLNRATTQTCAGCHEHSNGANIGNGLTWPPSRGFVHVDENGALSPALTQTFLPFRRCVLDSFIKQTCQGQALGIAEAGKTIGGQSVGAAN